MIIVSIPSTHFMEVNQLVSSSIDGITPELLPQEGDKPAQEVVEETRQEHLDWQWILLGYLFSFFAIVGVFIGLTLITSSKRLRNGERMRIYDEATIRHGRIMLLIGVITSLWFIYRKFIAVFLMK
jgi:hypothetical protein